MTFAGGGNYLLRTFSATQKNRRMAVLFIAERGIANARKQTAGNRRGNAFLREKIENT